MQLTEFFRNIRSKEEWLAISYTLVELPERDELVLRSTLSGLDVFVIPLQFPL